MHYGSQRWAIQYVIRYLVFTLQRCICKRDKSRHKGGSFVELPSSSLLPWEWAKLKDVLNLLKSPCDSASFKKLVPKSLVMLASAQP